jgi:glyoxylase-like metal-dependent hydrolase (beta-lactamase superfamily II)
MLKLILSAKVSPPSVDAPPSIAQNYLKAIVEVTDKPITHVIYSHAHLDHIGAVRLFPKNATPIAHQDTPAELKRAIRLTKSDSTISPIPTITFKITTHYRLEIRHLKWIIMTIITCQETCLFMLQISEHSY